MKNTQTNVVKFVDSAIQLKKQMTEEQAIYRCFLLACGTTVTNAEIDIDDEESSNRTMLFCTFPGLHRLVLGDDKKMEILTVVKAQGMLNLPTEVTERNNETESRSENVSDTATAERREETGLSENVGTE